MAHGYQIALRALCEVRQSEQVDPANVTMLCESIVRAGHWLEPIIVERSRGIVMDGNHRFTAALQLGLKRVPCIQLDYGDPRVCVRHWQTGQVFEVERIFRTIARGEMFPYKTTRHAFDPALPVVAIPLERLYA
ncbi:ParB N-terminal domain-containing protein [Pseudomonas granadensis]|uniref:ParB N-terminal domain-containing protein n=1 Tax=Pseudomonas granadensis TaxID=1421430 RepID=UPI00087BD831|nr:ParB N-terminal domain-containing protein [Pseudomonas granadensis]SDT22531.1 ParB-like nuclease domain-containing protein [Pseudomonas granadensis]